MTGQVIVGAAATNGTTTSGTTTSNSTMSGNMTMSGNKTVPEFGPVASIILIVAIVGVVIMSARTRGFLKL
jgi:predicted secreted protein with PEFG-CTERM motif